MWNLFQMMVTYTFYSLSHPHMHITVSVSGHCLWILVSALQPSSQRQKEVASLWQQRRWLSWCTSQCQESGGREEGMRSVNVSLEASSSSSLLVRMRNTYLFRVYVHLIVKQCLPGYINPPYMKSLIQRLQPPSLVLWTLSSIPPTVLWSPTPLIWAPSNYDLCTDSTGQYHQLFLSLLQYK